MPDTNTKSEGKTILTIKEYDAFKAAVELTKKDTKMTNVIYKHEENAIDLLIQWIVDDEDTFMSMKRKLAERQTIQLIHR